jgi:hypothetical protein
LSGMPMLRNREAIDCARRVAALSGVLRSG